MLIINIALIRKQENLHTIHDRKTAPISISGLYNLFLARDRMDFPTKLYYPWWRGGASGLVCDIANRW